VLDPFDHLDSALKLKPASRPRFRHQPGSVHFVPHQGVLAEGVLMATFRGSYYRLNAYQEPAIPKGLTELRTHGVNGAPPEQLLNDPHPVLVSGDDTAAFYRSRERPSGYLERTVEAYSWTGLNSRAGSRAFWLLLFPFGMANFAGWLIPDRWTSMPWWTRGRTPIARGLIRVLGVAFTIHYGLWAMVIAVDLLAVQCGQVPACYTQRWLGWFDAIRERLADPAALMVAFTAVPLLLIGLLWLLGRRNARLYDRYWADTDCADASRAPRFGLVDDLQLRQTEFWRAASFVQLQALLHATAAVGAVGATLAWTLTRSSTPDASSTRLEWLERLGWFLAVVAGLAVAATAATGALSHRRAPTGHPYPRSKWMARVLLGVALGLVAAVGWLGWTTPVTPTVPLPGLRHAFGGVMVAELVLLLGLCSLVELRLGGSILAAGFLLFYALEWDQPRPMWWLWMLVAVVAAAVALAIYVRRSAADQGGELDPSRHLNNPYWIFAGLAVVMLVTILGWRAEQASWPNRILIAVVAIIYLMGAFAIQIRRAHDYPPSWQLRGGGLAAIAAVGAIGLTIVSAATIVFVADRLGHAVARLPGDDTTIVVASKQISYPGELGWIAAAALAPLIIFILALSTRLLSLWWYRWRGQISQLHDSYDRDADHLGPGQLDVPDPDRRFARSAARARLFGGLVDDADWLISAAVVTMLAGAVSLMIDLREPEPPSQGLGQIVGFSSWALGFIVLGAIWLVRTARTDSGLRRAVGIVWDVASFFPRRFHPLAPPSYAERSVPELRGRLIDLTANGQVLLIAHSQGTLVSAAALLTLLGDPACAPRIRRIAWITYGCMLRRLFGRAYPLAVRRTDLVALKAALEHHGPVEGDTFPIPPASRPPYWMNFGRHSDYLGGRVFTDLQRPPPRSTQDRPDDLFFGDPTRRWRFRGQTQQARLWRHSFDYLDDAEDPRFADHVARIIQHLRIRQLPQ
jgi:hypothetical protein